MLSFFKKPSKPTRHPFTLRAREYWRTIPTYQQRKAHAINNANLNAVIRNIDKTTQNLVNLQRQVYNLQNGEMPKLEKNGTLYVIKKHIKDLQEIRKKTMMKKNRRALK